MACRFDLLVHGHGEIGQPRQIGIGIGFCRDDVLGVEERWSLAVTSRELAEDIRLARAAGPIGKTLVGIGVGQQPVKDHVIADLALGRERIAVNGLAAVTAGWP